MVEKNVKSFVEGSMPAKDFFDWLYTDAQAEEEFMAEDDLPPWAQALAINLYYYLISGDYNSSHFICNAKELLEQYLQRHSVDFAHDDSYNHNYDILCKVMPKWLDPDVDYFEAIFNDKSLSESEIKDKIKEKIKMDFRYVHQPPHWLQSPNWPIVEHHPLLFIGELELCKEKGRARIYVFQEKKPGEYKIINQAD